MTPRKPSKAMRLVTRAIVGGSQFVAFAVCLYAVNNGLWLVGSVGAASTLIVGLVLCLAPDTEAT
jgi:hypothetical protein